MKNNSAKHRIFKLTDGELLAIGSRGLMRKFAKGEKIVSQGEPSASLYVILEGRVEAHLTDGSGRKHLLGSQGPGEYFGEMSLDTDVGSATVVAAMPSRLLVVSKANFRDAVLHHPVFALSLVEKLIDRAQTLTQRLHDLGETPAPPRAVGD